MIGKISKFKTNVESVPDKWCESDIRHRMANVQLQEGTINQSLSRTVVETQICFLVLQVAWKSGIFVHKHT